jgi:hypothetical protein
LHVEDRRINLKLLSWCILVLILGCLIEELLVVDFF